MAYLRMHHVTYHRFREIVLFPTLNTVGNVDDVFRNLTTSWAVLPDFNGTPRILRLDWYSAVLLYCFIGFAILASIYFSIILISPSISSDLLEFFLYLHISPGYHPIRMKHTILCFKVSSSLRRFRLLQ